MHSRWKFKLVYSNILYVKLLLLGKQYDVINTHPYVVAYPLREVSSSVYYIPCSWKFNLVHSNPFEMKLLYTELKVSLYKGV